MPEQPEIPTARPGDRISLQTANRPVMALAMNEQFDQSQVMGLVPNAEDGCRVAIGAGLRNNGIGVQMTLCNLLDPEQAMETSIRLGQLASQAALLRGRPLQVQQIMDETMADMATEIAAPVELPGDGQAVGVGNGFATGRPRNGMAIRCQVSFPDDQVAVLGLMGVANITLPDGSEWVVFNIRDVEGGREAQSSMPLTNAASFLECANDAAIHGAEREKATGQGRVS